MNLLEELDKYRIVNEIGKGSVSTVYEVIDKTSVTKARWAVKTVDLKFKSEEDVHSVLQEVRILAQLHKHPSIPKFHDAFINKDHLA